MKNITNTIISTVIALVLVVGSIKAGIMLADSYTASCAADKAKIKAKREELSKFSSYYNSLDIVGQDSIKRLYNINL